MVKVKRVFIRGIDAEVVSTHKVKKKHVKTPFTS